MSVSDFSVAYRAANLVDVLIPRQDGVDGYRLDGSSDFDGSVAFQALFTADIGRGHLDQSINRGRLHTMPGQHVRAVFDPDNYTSDNISDSRQFWMRLTPVVNGVPGTPGTPVLILTPSQLRGENRVVIEGTAPNEAAIADSLKICLPRRVTGLQITNNDGTNDLSVAFNDDGPEMTIGNGEARGFWGLGAVDTLLVRGGAGTIAFSADFSIATSW